MKKQKYKESNFLIETNYSDKAKKEKLIKFKVVEGDSFEISVDDLIALLTKDFDSSVSTEQWVKLFDTKVRTFPIMEVERNVVFEASEDLSKGAKVNVKFKQHLPFTFALMEEKINKDMELNKDKVRDVTIDELKEYYNSLPEDIKNNHKGFFKQEIGDL